MENSPAGQLKRGLGDYGRSQVFPIEAERSSLSGPAATNITSHSNQFKIRFGMVAELSLIPLR